MTFNDYLKQPESTKITIVEIDAPIQTTWINYQPGIWTSTLTTSPTTYTDDRGVTGYWGHENQERYNINSFSIDGVSYVEVDSLAECITNEKTWYYDISTTMIYIHFDNWLNPETYLNVSPGAVIGFTNNIDNTVNNYFEDIYYEPLIQSVPNFTKKKDALFFGLLQYQGGTVVLDNTAGYFDNFAKRDLYGQPVRIKLSFEGLPYSDALLVYTGRVEDFNHDFINFNLNVKDIRKQITRSMPVNNFSTTDTSSEYYFPDMDNKMDGTPVPISYGPVIKAPTYKTDEGEWTFADTTYHSIDSTIIVYNEDGSIFSHTGTVTDGTFTGTDTDDKLLVSFTQSEITNGLDIITDIMLNYQDIEYNELYYDVIEWEQEKGDVKDEGLWIGKGNVMTTIDVIEQICTDNQGIFDVLADGRFTFRSYNPNRIPSHEIFEDELLNDPSSTYDADEYLSSVKIEHSFNRDEKDFEIYTNYDYQNEVFGRYRHRKERTFTTSLTNRTDAQELSEQIMTLSKEILPTIVFTTKTQNVNVRVLDNILYLYSRQNGSEILKRSKYQILSIMLDLTKYEVNIGMKLIEEDDQNYIIIDGGTATTDYNYYDGGTATYVPLAIIDGGIA